MTSPGERNKQVYESDALARKYAEQQPLQPPEETILNIVLRELAPRRVLDLGVGGGRTTGQFSALAQEYVGIDYSERMVAACRARFTEESGKLEFHVADVRSMPMFADGHFDFVLFSYNGIDYISAATRGQALQEIRRVLRTDGYFAFSSHNLNSLKNRLRWKWNRNLKATVSGLLWLLQLRRHNPGLGDLAAVEGVEVNDGALDFQLRTYYQQPKAQVAELRRVGFEDIRAFRLSDGRLIESELELDAIDEDWLYYVCRRA